MTGRCRRGRTAVAVVLLGVLAGCLAFNSRNVKVGRTTSLQQELEDLDRALAEEAITPEEHDLLERELTAQIRGKRPAEFEKPGE